jgi:hypothetical protein
LGRIRLSVLPGACSLAGGLNPPLANGCTPTNPPAGTPGTTYLDNYPN